MLRRVAKWLRNPRRYVPLAIKLAQQPLCYPFRSAPFFLQGQMDISPRSRWHNPEFTVSTGGFYPKNSAVERRICDLEPKKPRAKKGK